MIYIWCCLMFPQGAIPYDVFNLSDKFKTSYGIAPCVERGRTNLFKKTCTLWISLNSWFKPYVSSILIQTFSLSLSLYSRISVHDEVVFLICSIIANFLYVLKSWLDKLKCLQAGIALGSLMSFPWLFNLTWIGVLDFPTYCIL